MDPKPITEFFDREAGACCRADPPSFDGVSGISSVLLERLEEVGIEGLTLLDLGCGTGGLAVEALRRGASRVKGIDLSPASVEVARRRTRSAGFEDRADFEVGDAAVPAVDGHDVVVLDKAICCYPDPDRLVSSSAARARRLYGFSLPTSRGPRGLLARAVLFFENAWRRVRRDPFRSFVHDVDRIDAAVRAGGLEPVVRMQRWMWHLAVYRRSPTGGPDT